MGDTFTRRDFLRLATGSATLLAAGTGCRSGPDKSSPEEAATTTGPGAKGRPTLRIAQWNNYVADYDQWFDDEYTKGWGERNGVEVTVDHFDINQTTAHAEAEVASQQGHDLFNLILASPAAFEDQVVDHREIVEEVEARIGKMLPFVERSVFNPTTKKYFGFSPFWSPNPVQYRTDLWEDDRPDTWDAVLTTGRRLKAAGHPIGIGMGDNPESNATLLGLMHGYGASLQDEDGRVTINSPATVEAVNVGADLFRQAMSPEVLNWDITSNNRYLVSGRGSLILNSVAALRALETQDPALGARVALLPVPRAVEPGLSPYSIGTYVIWNFSEHRETAMQFLVDLATDYREHFIRTGFLQHPSFPGAAEDLGELVANDGRGQPADKYTLLARASEWTTNVGHPGHFNAAADEVIRSSLVSQMFAATARGDMSAAEAVRAAEARIGPIYDKWREQGKI